MNYKTVGQRPTQQNSPRPRTKCIEPYYSQACLKGFSKFWAMCSTQSLIVSNFLEKFSIFIERFSKFEQDFPNVNKIFQFSIQSTYIDWILHLTFCVTLDLLARFLIMPRSMLKFFTFLECWNHSSSFELWTIHVRLV